MADQPHPESGSGEDAGSAGAEPGRPLSTTRPPMDGIPVGFVVSSVVREDDSGDPTAGDTTAVVSNAKAEGAGVGGGTGAPDLNPGIEAAAADIDADDYAIYDPLSRDQYPGEDNVAYQHRRSISMVFVYGTLRPDNDTGSMHTARFAADMAVKIKATVRGARLFVDTLYPSAVWLAGEGADDLQARTPPCLFPWNACVWLVRVLSLAVSSIFSPTQTFSPFHRTAVETRWCTDMWWLPATSACLLT